MANFALSNHAIEQITLRGLTVLMVETVLQNADVIIEEGDSQVIYQGVIQRNGKDYLLRIFVNGNKMPNLVKTVYLTSKISKYQ